ncbi:MAG: hypothetical protein CM15mP102_21120 [Flavobacteriales bacterium]|nr:MAG: hypothetical protein CM15mP102_21120 [Flavobacteriales bacterium]
MLHQGPPAAAARHVVTRTREVFAGSADNTDPPLNPNHPNQSIRTPAADNGILEPGIAKLFHYYQIFLFSLLKDI